MGRRRYNNEFKLRIGNWLLQDRSVKMNELAKRLLVTKRTLRMWKAKAKIGCQARSGRPAYSQLEHRKAMWLVCRELRRQGYPGSPAIAFALKDQVPLRLIRLYVKNFKEKKKMRSILEIKKNRITAKVLRANVIWAQDGTHLGNANGKKIEAQIIKDRGSLKTICAYTGLATKGSETVKIMEELKIKRELPLIWMTDNGSAYCNREVEAFMKKEKVIHLKSLPRTPQHNGAAEVMMKEIKYATDLGKQNDSVEIHDAHFCLVEGIKKINDNRKRMSLAFESASDVDNKLLLLDKKVDRDTIYDEYCRGLNSIVIKNTNARRKRLEERKMVMCLLEKHGLIKQTRAGQDYVA